MRLESERDQRPSVGDRLPVARRPRRPLAIAAGAFLVIGSAAVGGALATRSNPPSAVLVLARPVAAGHLIGVEDVSVAHLSGSGVQGIAASSEASIIGQTAQANLPAGTLLNASMLTAAAVPGAGQQVVAVAVKAGAFPPELAAGRSVSVLQVSSSSGTASGPPAVLVAAARVLHVVPDASTGATVVSLLVDAPHALAVSEASAVGGVSLALLPVGS